MKLPSKADWVWIIPLSLGFSFITIAGFENKFVTLLAGIILLAIGVAACIATIKQENK